MHASSCVFLALIYFWEGGWVSRVACGLVGVGAESDLYVRL